MHWHSFAADYEAKLADSQLAAKIQTNGFVPTYKYRFEQLHYPVVVLIAAFAGQQAAVLATPLTVPVEILLGAGQLQVNPYISLTV